MNPIKALKLFALWEKAQSLAKENVSVNVKVAQYLHLAISALGLIGIPTLADNWLRQPAHAAVFGILAAVSLALHAISPSLFGGPSDAVKKAAGLGAVLLAILLLPSLCAAQTAAPPAPVPVPVPAVSAPSNIYAAGISWNNGNSSPIAGTALYAHRTSVTDVDSGLYMFTAVDALPASVKPFTVTTNIGAGVAQKLATIAGFDVYVPGATGVSFTGQNVGWQYNAGVLASRRIKGQYVAMLSVRFNKSSVSGGSGYQPIIGVLFGWGQ